MSIRFRIPVTLQMPTDQKPRLAPWRDPTQVSSVRSFVLMTMGALTGLLLAGYSLFTARSATTLSVPAEDVALVNQQAISRSDYLILLQTLYGVDLNHATREQRQKTLNDMIREELFVQRGKELDLASTDPEVRSALVNAVELEISENAITAQPSEASLRQYYASHPDRYVSEGVMNVRDWVFPEGEPRDLAAMLPTLKSADIPAETLARLHVHESDKTKGDEFYFAAKIHLGDQLFASARELSDGATSSPIPLSDGVHVLYMVKNKRPVPFDFAKARPQVLNDYRNQAIDQLKAGDESFLRKRANVRVADDLR
jgi:parvulin-like peptidyl-prolyl cis-trans isomerase-like protein/SurA-like protein